MTRQEVLDLIDQRIFTNNSKLITAEFVNEVCKALIGNSFVPESDTLRLLQYNNSLTLEEKLNEIEVGGASPIMFYGVSTVFNVNSVSAGTNIKSSGSVTSMQVVARNSQETLINVVFPLPPASWEVVLTWQGNGTWHQNNAVLLTMGSTVSSGGNITLQVIAQRVFDDPSGRLRIMIIKV